MSEELICPFCADNDFDLMGLADHIASDCKGYSEALALSIIEQEESVNRAVARINSKQSED